MDIISYIHKSVALLFQILELEEVWTPWKYGAVAANRDLHARALIIKRRYECVSPLGLAAVKSQR
jgi:hypothetical protein